MTRHDMGTVMEHATVKVRLTTFSIWLTWRIWRFTLRPLLYSSEPKELPYLLPFIGHANAFFQDFNGAISRGRKYFGPTQECFSMIVAGQTIYVVTSAKDINAVWANSKTISMDPLTMDMYAMAGITEKCRKKMFTSYPEARYNTRNAKPMTPTQMTIDLHHQQLHRGQKLDAMMNDKVISRLLQDLDFSAPNHPAVKARSGSTYSVSLYNLSVHAFITADTDAFWGSKLRQIIPDFIPAFEDWEQTNWKLLFQLPAPFAKDMLQARETIAGGFAKYYSLPRYERPEASYFSKNVEDVLREVGLTEGEMGCFMLLHYWAIVGNAYKLAFWVVAYLTADQDLLQQIRQETAMAINDSSVDETHLMEHCPRLASLMDETLRLTVTSSLARTITEPTVIGKKVLKPGNKIMLPIKELHFDPTIWGPDPKQLQPSRFLDNPKLAKSTSYRPWGGGATMCSGRLLARRSIYAFVAILLARYDIEVEPGSVFPQADGARPSPGVILVGKGEDVKLRCTPRRA